MNAWRPHHVPASPQLHAFERGSASESSQFEQLELNTKHQSPHTVAFLHPASLLTFSTDATMTPHHCRNRSHSHPMIEPTTEPIELSGAPVPVEEGENLEPLEHEALFGDEITSEKLVEKQATIAVLGATPFEDDGNEMEHHTVVVTEIVADPIAAHEPEPIVSHWPCVPTIPRMIFRRRKHETNIGTRYFYISSCTYLVAHFVAE